MNEKDHFSDQVAQGDRVSMNELRRELGRQISAVREVPSSAVFSREFVLQLLRQIDAVLRQL